MAGRPVPVPPPSNFRPLVGRPREIVYHTNGYVRQKGNTPAKEAGLRYEEKVQRGLLLQYPTYDACPTLSFADDAGPRRLRPDGILHLPERKVIFEIKLQHMPEAYWQLEKLYKPVMAARSHHPIQVIEVCSSFDVAMPFPCPVRFSTDLRALLDGPPDEFGVYLWKL